MSFPLKRTTDTYKIVRGKILNSYVGKTARLMDQYFKQIVGLFCRHPDDKKYRQTHDY